MKIFSSTLFLLSLVFFLLGTSAGAKEVCEMNKYEGKLAGLRLETIKALQDLEKTSGNECKALKEYLPHLIASFETTINIKAVERMEQEELSYRESVRRSSAGLAITHPNYAMCSGVPHPEDCLAEKYVLRKREIELETGPTQSSDATKVRQSVDSFSMSMDTALEKSRANDCPDSSPVLHAFLGAAFNISKDAGYVFPGGQFAGVGITTSLAALSKLIKSIFNRPGLREKFLAKITTPSGDDVVCLMNTIHQKLLKCGASDGTVPERTKPGVDKMDPSLSAAYDRSSIPTSVRTLSSEITVPGSDKNEKAPVHAHLRSMAKDFAAYEKLRDEKNQRLLASDAGGLSSLLELGNTLKKTQQSQVTQLSLKAYSDKTSSLTLELAAAKEAVGGKSLAETKADIAEIEAEMEDWKRQVNGGQETIAHQKQLREKLRKLKALELKFTRLEEIPKELATLEAQKKSAENIAAPSVVQKDSEVVQGLLNSFERIRDAQKKGDVAELKAALTQYQSDQKNFNAQFSPIESPYLLHSKDQEAGFALNGAVQRHAEIMKDLKQVDEARFSQWKKMDILYRDNQLVVEQLKERASELGELRAMERDLAELSNTLLATYAPLLKTKLKTTIDQAQDNHIFPRDAFLYCTLGAPAFLFQETVATPKDASKLAYKHVKVSKDWDDFCMPLLGCHVEELYKAEKGADRWPPSVPEEVKGVFFKTSHALPPSANGQPEVIKKVHHYLCKLSLDSNQILQKAEKEFYAKGTICDKRLQEIENPDRNRRERPIIQPHKAAPAGKQR
jgi:hypothetical protein